MSGRTDQDGLPPERPPAARRYETEWEELLAQMTDPGGWNQEATRAWLDRTLYMHREQARAVALQESYRGTWWDRNWFALAFLGMIAAAMLMIGLINGWS